MTDDDADPTATDRSQGERNPSEEPDPDAVVEVAADAAEGVIFSRYKQSAIRDVDVTVTFEDGILDVDVYLNVSDDASGPDPDRVADDAALAARAAVDELFAES